MNVLTLRSGAAPFAAVFTAAALTVLLAIGVQPHPAQATHGGNADFMLIDMDPGAAPANTATSFGTIETCAQINENNFLDADEDAVDTLDIDVVVQGIPTPVSGHGGMIGFQFQLNYPKDDVMVASYDNEWLLAANPTSSIFELSDPRPDADGQFLVSVGDSASFSIHESGDGVLSRIHLETVGSPVSGVHELSLSFPVIYDINLDAYFPENGFGIDAYPSARVAIGQPCPPEADVEITSVSVSVFSDVLRSVPFNAILDVTVHNAGPAPATVNSDVFIRDSIFPEPDCDIPSRSFPNVSLPPSAAVNLSTTVIIRCHQSGTQTLDVSAAIEPDDLGLSDPYPLNNFLQSSATPIFVHALVDADDDLVVDTLDNCPNVPNPGQEDTDGDGIADACESQPPIAVGGIAGLLDSRPGATPSASEPTSAKPVPILAIAAATGALFATALLIRRRAR